MAAVTIIWIYWKLWKVHTINSVVGDLCLSAMHRISEAHFFFLLAVIWETRG